MHRVRRLQPLNAVEAGSACRCDQLTAAVLVNYATCTVLSAWAALPPLRASGPGTGCIGQACALCWKGQGGLSSECGFPPRCCMAL